MITLRILKKKSKQAREILIAHYRFQSKDFFLAERRDNYHGQRIRCGCPQKGDLGRGCDCQWHPLKGTPMTGETSGYYEPEWDERTAFEDLQKKIMWEARPATISDREWSRILSITGVKPITAEKVEDWFREDDDLACEAAG